MLSYKSYFLFLLTLSLLMPSCQKESFKSKKGNQRVESRNFSLYLLAELAHKDWNGTISISNRKLFGAEEAVVNSEGTNVRATFLDNFHDGRISEGKLAITAAESTSLDILPDERHVYRTGREGSNTVKSFYGKEISLTLEGAAPDSGPVFSKSLDIPTPIFVTNPVLGNIFTTSINRGFDLIWNPDAGNEKGIFILIDFDPGSPFNSSFEGMDRVNSVLHVEDTGFYPLTEEHFAGTPSGARVDLIVGRGEYTQAVDSATQEKEYLIYSYTVAIGRITLE